MMRRHRRDLKPLAEINLTSLLDVSFVLLISFMLVAPSLKYGFELNLPPAGGEAPSLTTDQQNMVTILLPKPTGAPQQFFLDEKAVTLVELESALQARQDAAQGKLSVEIQADRDVPYEAFVQVVGAVRRAGVEAVGLPVETGDVQAPVTTLADPSKPLPR